MKKGGYYLIVNVFQEKVIEEVVMAMTAAGMRDILSVSGSNETRRLPHTIPIFAGFKGALGRTSPMSKLFTAYIDREDRVDEMLAHLKMGDIDFIGDDLGTLVLIPADSYYSKEE